MDLNRIRVFRAVVAAGGIHAAAANLGYTPSAVSQHVATLQRESGLKLTERIGRGLRITADGHALAREGEDVLLALQRLERTTQHIRDGVGAHIAISTFASFAQACLPVLTGQLRGQFPDLVLELELTEIRSGSRHSQADVEIRTEDPNGAVSQQLGYHRIVLGEEPYLLVLPHDHPLGGQSRVEMHTLADVPLINSTSDDVICGEIVKQCCRAAGISPQFVTQVGDHTTAAAFVHAGIGCAVLPELALRNCPYPVVTTRLTGPEPRRRVIAFVRDQSRANPAVEAAVHRLREWASDTWDAAPTEATG